ncbi:hypothetical protein GN958_ATG16956 [Phytophthora infestans]|uniref:Uncharacterized protein n=1 Tax=Phytophthora infestans TaxID=4787 RepID=A0A8S9U390_PHYIN|nr:hypothetical protein GN958_ATG16956 [Phytophthora infestans]
MVGAVARKKVKKTNYVKVKKSLTVTKKKSPTPTTGQTLLESSIANGELTEVEDVANLIYPGDVSDETSSPPRH